MIDGNQRSPLAADRHIGLAHVGDDIDAQRRGDFGGIADLDRQSAIGAVEDRLAVVADQFDLAGAGHGEQLFGAADMRVDDDVVGLGQQRGFGIAGRDDLLGGLFHDGALVRLKAQQMGRTEVVDHFTVRA